MQRRRGYTTAGVIRCGAALVGALLASGCGSSEGCDLSNTGDEGCAPVTPPVTPPASEGMAFDLGSASEEALPEPEPVTAFMDIEAVDYRIAGAALRSQPARLFYSFVPADEDAKERPVFVIFNGGPGASTTGILHAFGTGPTTVATDPPSATVSTNPSSFTRAGNLLYIDARGVGFSYGLASDPSDAAQRTEGLGVGSMNLLVDAADFTRVVLRVLDQQPALRNNRVVLVGESYGAHRAALVTSYLFGPAQLANGGAAGALAYEDVALAEELEAHYESVFPDTPFEALDASVASRQFGAQVLIQPAYSVLLPSEQGPAALAQIAEADCSEGAAMRKAADARGVACPLQGSTYDPEHFMKPAGWNDALRVAALSTMLDPPSFEQRFLAPPGSVVGLAAGERAGAFRLLDDADAADRPNPMSTSWIAELGALPAWDYYHIERPSRAFGANAPAWTSSEFVSQSAIRLFADQLPWVQTLITDALFDVRFPSQLTVQVIDMLRSNAGLDATASYSGAALDGELRPGWMTVDYGPSASLPENRRQARVRMPLYGESPHAVTTTEGPELLEDIETFFFAAPAVPAN